MGIAETTRYTYNSLNQLLSSETKKADGTVTASKTYQYDANGNQLKDSDSIGKKETQNTYDAAGRLSACTIKENGKAATQQINQYNGSGTRIQKAENGMVTNYYYSQGGVLYTEDGNGKGTSLNLHGTLGNIIATGRKAENKEGYYYYHKDPAGSITNLRDAGGKSIVSYQYTDFGQTNIHGDADFYNEICYNESIYDRSTGLYYLSARYYDPEDGRFISRDSYRGNFTNPSTFHLYAYCANNPVNYEDPSGHIALSRIVGGIVGAAAGIFTGSKIAKKTKAKGWKKVAIITGCAVGGAVVGAVVGPKVAKVAKKAVNTVKRKLPSKNSISKDRRTVTKSKTAVKKTVSKTKIAIKKSPIKKAITKPAIKKASIKAGTGAVRGGVSGYLHSKASSGNARNGTISGAIGGAISGFGGTLFEKTKSVKAAVDRISGFSSGYINSRLENKKNSQSLTAGVFHGIRQGFLGKMNNFFEKNISNGNDLVSLTDKVFIGTVADVFDFSSGMVVDFLAPHFKIY